MLLLALQRAVESHFTHRATQGRQFIARRIATNYKILLLHFKGFRVIGESEEYNIIVKWSQQKMNSGTRYS